MGSKTVKAKRSLETTGDVYRMVKNHYEEALRAKEDRSKPICWIGVQDPIELFRAMDIVPVFPENFSATCGAKQLTVPSCEVAENDGYSRDLCSYFRNTYGYMVEGDNLEEPPGGGLPDPDLLVIIINSCKLRAKWWRITERHYKVPTFIMELPNFSWSQSRHSLSPHYREFALKQIHRLVKFLEEHTGHRLDEDRLKEALAYTDRASAYYDKILKLRKAVPCPMGAEDMATAISPMIFARGTADCENFYRRLYHELEERVRAGKGVLPDERFRLLVDNIPPWYTRGMYNYFHKYGGISVVETYTSVFCWHARMDVNKPWDSIAEACSINWLNFSYRERKEMLLDIAREYRVDGAIFLANKGCKVYSGCNTFLSNLLRDELGIPSLVLEADQTDPRDYADSQVKMRIDAFMEMLGRE